MLTYNNKISFFQRWFNAVLVVGLYDWTMRQYFHLLAEDFYDFRMFYYFIIIHKE